MGAGVLFGPTQAGTRSEFDMVAGVSTGVLIASFAFLGPEYDGRLTRIHTETSTSDIARFNVMGAIFEIGYVASTRAMVEANYQELDAKVICAIAQEACKGRSQIVGATNIDATRPVF